MIVRKLYISFFALLLVPVLLCAQAGDGPFTGISGRFYDFTSRHLQEKLYLRTDREAYLAGEICWFSLFDVDGLELHPLDLSNVVYVEILNNKHQPLLQATVALREGKGQGSFYLPVSLESGSYLIRAYSNWMKNTGPEYFFQKSITLINSFKPLPPTSLDSVPETFSPQILFFPEGGNLVQGISSVLAFKVNDQQGHGLPFEGWVMDGLSDTLLHFAPLHDGMGRFRLMPREGHRYTALLQFSNGQVKQVPLPLAFESGYTLAVESDEPGKLRVLVQQNIKNEAPDGQALYILLHNAGQIIRAAALEPVRGKAVWSLDSADLPAGISSLTLFNPSRQPVCERLLFAYPRQRLALAAETDSTSYSTRAPVNITLRSRNENSAPAPSSLSVSVFRQDSGEPSSASPDIFSYLWLCSDLRGYIESPAWYFQEGNDSCRPALDNLLLTQGWRRFRWEDILSHHKSDSSYLPEFHGQILSGTVFQAPGKPFPGVPVSFSVPGNQLLFFETNTDDRGRFRFHIRGYYGDNEVVLRALPHSGINCLLQVDTPYSRQFGYYPLPAFRLRQEDSADLMTRHLDMQVLNVYAGDRLNQTERPGWDSLAFYGPPKSHYFLDDYTRFVTMEEVLREYVPLVAVRKSEGSLHLRVIDDERRELYSSDPLILLDAVPVSSDSILAFDPLKVKSLSLINRRFVNGEFVYDGIVDFRTYEGKAGALPLDPSALKIDYAGLQLRREFYSPAYPTKKERSSSLPDFRQLLYWSPLQATGADGLTHLRFYTSDQPGRYLLLVEGIDGTGRAGRTWTSFTVGAGGVD